MKLVLDQYEDIIIKNPFPGNQPINNKKRTQKSADEEDSEAGQEDDIDEPVKKGVSSKKNRNEDDEDAEDEVEDDWEKQDDDFDPDFEEFDIPKSKIKTGPSTAGKGDEDDLGLDDDFKSLDLFNDGSGTDEDEEDDF